jgi:trigger factor
MQFDLQIEEVSQSQRILHFSLAQTIVNTELDKAYADIQKNIRIKGYRRGKVPRWLIEKKYSSGIEPDVAEKLIDRVYRDAEKPFQVVGRPQLVEEVTSLPKGDDFKFSVRVDIFPVVENVNYQGLEIPYEEPNVSDEVIEESVQARVASKASYEELEEGKVIGTDDFALVSLKLTAGDEVLREEASTMLNVSNERFYPGVGELLEGMTVNETKTAEVTIGESSAFEDLRGKEVSVELTVQSAQSKATPELTDELSVELGYENVEQMRVAIADDMIERQKSSAKEKARIAILQKLVEANEIDVPDGLVFDQLSNLVEEMRMRRAYMTGKNPKEIQFTEAEQADFHGRAAFAAKASILIAGVAKSETIEVLDEDIDAKINEIAAARGETDVSIRAYIEAEDAMPVLKERIIEEKTLDWLFNNCNLVAPEAVTETSEKAEAKPASAAPQVSMKNTKAELVAAAEGLGLKTKGLTKAQLLAAIESA